MEARQTGRLRLARAFSFVLWVLARIDEVSGFRGLASSNDQRTRCLALTWSEGSPYLALWKASESMGTSVWKPQLTCDSPLFR